MAGHIYTVYKHLQLSRSTPTMLSSQAGTRKTKMKNKSQKEPEKSVVKAYKIVVKGILAENWADWFNGMLINFEHDLEENPQTVLTCKVRDQAELNGILNWLHNMNLSLIEVRLVDQMKQERK